MKWGCPDASPPIQKDCTAVRSIRRACCGQHGQLDDEAEFIHRIVMVDMLRNDLVISGHNVHSFLPEVFSQEVGGWGRRDFSTSKRPPTHHCTLKRRLKD